MNYELIDIYLLTLRSFRVATNLTYVSLINVSCDWIISWLVNFIDLKVIQGCHELNKLPNYDIFELLKHC